MKFLPILFCLSLTAVADEIDRLLPALAKVESNNNSRAVGDNGRAIGLYQIQPIFVKDVNRIAKTKYTLADRYDPIKSAQMVRIYLSHYGKGKTILELAAIHNAGPRGAEKLKTNKNVKRYVVKVRRELND